MECGVCLENIQKACVGSCGHHFCHACLLEWARTSHQCPKCREDILEIRVDPEFDELQARAGC